MRLSAAQMSKSALGGPYLQPIKKHLIDFSYRDCTNPEVVDVVGHPSLQARSKTLLLRQGRAGQCRASQAHTSAESTGQRVPVGPPGVVLQRVMHS